MSNALRLAVWLVLTAFTAFVGGRSDRAFRARDVNVPVEIRRDRPYGETDGHRLTLDLYLPTRPAPASGRPAILAIHGGSWIGGSKRMFRPGLREPHPTAVQLAEAGFVVVAPDYRTARPGIPAWPDARVDVRLALTWVRRHARELAIDPDRIAAFGQSAGGHLAACLGTMDGEDRVDAVISFYAPTDLERLPDERVHPLAHEPVRMLLGGGPKSPPAIARDASPIHHVDHDTAPMLLVHGSLDRWVPITQSERMVEALARASVAHRLIRIDGARHGFELHVDDPGVDDPRLLDAILEFLESVWNVSLSGSTDTHPSMPH